MSFARAARSLQRYRPQALRWLAGLAVCVGIAALYLSGSLQFIDRQLTAARFQLVTSKPTGDVVVVEIDADSLQKIAVWPWPREVHARVIDRLREAGARLIAVDIDFSAESTKGDDQLLADALARAGGKVILPVFEQADSKRGITSTKPLPMFAEHTRIASVVMYPDSDGIVRRLARVDVWKGNPVPTMAAAAAGLDPAATGRYYVDFGIAADQIMTVSYVEVLDDAKFDPKDFAGKIVMIGATAQELGDTVATPVGGVMPAVMVQALATESLLQDRDLHKVSRWLILAVACILFFMIEGICRKRGWRHGVAAGAGALVAIIGLPLVVQANLPLMVETAPWLAAVTAAFLVALFERLRDLDLRLIGQAILLRRTDALMRQVVENSTDGLLVIDEQGKVRSANPAAERMLGQPAGELIGQHFFDVIATPSHQPPIHSLSRMAYADRPSQMELTRPDGSTLIADVGLSRLPEQQPNAAFVAQLHDVTEMKMREAELRAARDQAEAASNSKSQFLANMSHELRTPLNAVIGFSEIMKTELLGPIGTETYRGYSHSIHDSAKHLLGIINDILDISSIESGSPRLHEGIHEPEQICQSVVALVAGRAEQAQVKLAVNVDPATDLLYADGRMMKQMLINLVGNAIKFSQKGGTIEIKVSPAGPEPHGGIMFAVADQGIGIAKEDIPRILKPFEQVETAFARNFDGVGLGLPLVNSMARLHGATLTIDSELNVGTTVSILFTAARTRPRTPETAGTAQIVEIGTPVRIRAAE